jgi:gluconokinase
MIIIVIGPSGSGKTTVGKALAASLGWSFLDGDDFHPEENLRRMAAGIALDDDDRAPWLAAMAAAVRDAAAQGVPAVLACSALKRAYRTALADGPETAAQVRFVYLRASPTLLAERLSRRQGHFFKAALLGSQLRDLEEPHETEAAPTAVIDAALPPEAQVKEIRARFTL